MTCAGFKRPCAAMSWVKKHRQPQSTGRQLNNAERHVIFLASRLVYTTRDRRRTLLQRQMLWHTDGAVPQSLDATFPPNIYRKGALHSLGMLYISWGC